MEVLRKCTQCREDKPLTAYHKQSDKPSGLRSACKSCRVITRRRAYNKDKERHLAVNRAWAEANPDRRAAHSAKRRAFKLRATPSWAQLEVIKSWYTLAKLFDKTFGEVHHVDHIVPLQGKHICGLHVEYNLQVLTATENISKGNRYGS